MVTKRSVGLTERSEGLPMDRACPDETKRGSSSAHAWARLGPQGGTTTQGETRSPGTLRWACHVAYGPRVLPRVQALLLLLSEAKGNKLYWSEAD